MKDIDNISKNIAEEIVVESLNKVNKIIDNLLIPGTSPPRLIPKGERERKNNFGDYLKENGKDIADEIHINVPEKYINDYEIGSITKVNLLTNFLYQIKMIKEQNFSFREVTLHRINILSIHKKGREWEQIDLCLNLGLNPILAFNDYYIKYFNCVNIKSPILIFKRYIKFQKSPRLRDLYIKYPMTLNIMYKDITKKGENIMKDYFTSSSELHPNGKITINNFLFEDIINEKDIWTVEKNKLYFKLTNKYYIDKCPKHGISLNDFIDREKISNIDIWRWGKNVLNDSFDEVVNELKRQTFFEWFCKVPFRKYDLVKKYKKITDFEKIMVERQDNNQENEDEYYEIFKNIGYNDIREKLIDKMKILAGTSICKENEYIYQEIIPNVDGNNNNNLKIIKKSKLTKILLNYIEDVQDYIFHADDKRIRKYIRKEDLFDVIYGNEKIYEELLNENIFKILEKGLEDYEEEVINNEQFELQTPDIYILLGFHEFPSKFSRELWEGCEFATGYKWSLIIKLQSFLESTGWYYMYGLCCFFAQLIGPSYYLYNYYLIDKNEYCPNNSLTLNKFFAVAYYLVLYARMNSFWRSLTTTTWQYGNTTILTNDNYLRLTLIVNSICLCIIPLFTYTLFIEMSSITDLILNCLTGEFLINIDNLIIEFIGEEDYIKSITKDLLILSFVEKGFPKKNIMEGDTIELWIISALQILQMFGTLLMTGFVYKCI